MANYDFTADAQAAGFTDMRDATAYLIANGIDKYSIHSGSDWIEVSNRRNEAKAERLFNERAAQIRAQQAAPTTKPAPRVELASGRQVDYIMSLLARRQRDGATTGFMSGPTTRQGVEALSRREASTYIDSLTERY